MRSTRHVTTWILALALALLAVRCGSASRYDPPPSHTVDNSGAMHLPGLRSPQTTCVSCHGDDLRGGVVGVSCFACHGRRW